MPIKYLPHLFLSVPIFWVLFGFPVFESGWIDPKSITETEFMLYFIGSTVVSVLLSFKLINLLKK